MTFVSYPDMKAVSQNGRFRVEIIGQEKDESFRDQSNFVYKLVEASSGSELWQWRPSEQQGLADYPHEAWVSDQGWVVARLHQWFDGGLLVLSPNGELRFLAPLRDHAEGAAGLLQDEPDIHLGDTSAGPSWEASSIAAFHEYASKSYWSICTWWRRRIVIDLESGSMVKHLSPAQETVITDIQRDWILNALSQAGELQQPDDCWSEQTHDCYTAAYHAGVAGLRETESSLRAMETSKVTGGESSEYWFRYASLPLRLIAKVSLMRLGFEPRWIANFNLKNNLSGERLTLPDTAPERSPDMIQVGLDQKQLLNRMGPPEFLRNHWDYGFMEGGDPFTIRIHWEDKRWEGGDFDEYRRMLDREPPVVERVERIDLPLWRADPVHEYSLAHRF